MSGVVHTQFMRIMIYFSAFQILSIPYFFNITNYEEIAEKIKKKLIKYIRKGNKIITYACIVLAFSGMLIYTNILHNDNGVLPYKTIFERDKK